MRSLIRFFIDNNKFTLILTLFIAVVGVMGIYKLNAESFPSVDFATATVSTFYAGAGPDEIEEQITKPIEDEVRSVRGLKDVRSISQAGQSKITIRVDMDHYDVDVVMDDLQKAVQRVTDLPAGIKEQPKFQEINSEEFPAIELAVSGDNTNRKRDLFANFLKDVLEDNRRVLNVRLSGYREREFIVRLNKDKLDEHHLGIEEVVGVLRGRNQNIPAGNLKDINEKLLIKLDGKVENIQELSEVYIRSNFTGQKIKLKDVANVEDGMEEEKVLTKVNGEDATLVTVTKKAGEDTLALVKDIEDKLKSIKVPDGIKVSIYNNEAEKVKNRMEVLSSNAISGLVLVVFFLLIFLPGRIGIMASLSLPIAMLGVFGLMPYFGMNLNAITILALVIALGMLVDNSVVISENFTRLRQEGMEAREAAIQSAHQFWLPITGTALTTIAAFMPMLVTRGVMGEFIKYIPIIVSFSLVVSLLESFFLLPPRLEVMANAVKKNKQDTEGYNDWFHKVTVKFEKFMDLIIRRRYLTAVVFTGIILGSLFMLVKVNKFILFPAEQTEIYIARYELERGTPVAKTDEAAKLLSDSVKKVLGDNVQNIVARSGVVLTGPGDPQAKEGDNVGMLTIYMTREASFNLKHNDVLNSLREIKAPYLKDFSFEVIINGPPVGSALNATFRSSDKNQLNDLMTEIIAYLGTVKGIQNPQIDDVYGEDEVHVQLDYEKVARLGLDVKTIGDTIKTAHEGNIITKITLNNRKFDLRVRIQDADRTNIKQLEQIQIMDKNANLIPLGSIAKLERTKGTPVVKRFDFQRSKTLTADVDETVVTSIVANKLLLDKFNSLRSKYPESSIVFGGEGESTKESMSSLKDAMILALIGIFGVLVFLFKSYLRPLIIMTTIPLGLFGFAIAFFFHQRPVSFLALIGVIGLAGIIVNSGIVLISFIDEMRLEGKMSLQEILVKASGMRLRAVIVTSLTTVSGLFPTAYGIGGSDLLLIPMTMAMAWGLTSGTILTLAWIPCAYAILEDMMAFKNKLIKNIFSKKDKKFENYSSQV